MIVNPNVIENKYKCKKNVKNYLVKCGIPLLGFDRNYFYFTYTEKLKECLDKMPLGLKLLSLFEG